KGDLSASARKNALSSIRSFYRYLVSVQILQIDPSSSVRPPRVTVKPGVHLTGEELRELLDAPGGPRERIATFLLVYTAGRADEIRRVRWSDVDLQARTLTLHGKGDKYRMLDIHGALAAELRRWWFCLEDQSFRRPGLREALADPERNYVLLTPRGNQIGRNAMSRHVKARARRIGLRPRESDGTAVSPHALRRSFATLLLNDGHHIDAVADVLGHVSIDTTRKHYAFASNARRRATIEAFNV
ncbi:MAG: tyrosine-type recombinase/integrase, partial [Thermoleophilia bacterium]|nr:tyrosine-type recombinase/integrase [Thermoleophilia bacterium]